MAMSRVNERTVQGQHTISAVPVGVRLQFLYPRRTSNGGVVDGMGFPETYRYGIGN